MSFEWPGVLLALLLIPLLVGVYVWTQRRRRKYALRYASVGLVREAIGRGPGIRRHLPAAAYLLAVTAMIVALARPEAEISVPHEQGTVILVIDISASMQATDVRPNRMEATKEAASAFVRDQPGGVEVGVVSFSDFALLVQPPTREKDEVLRAIQRLRTQRGTNIGGGLQAALDTIYEATEMLPPGTNASIERPTPPPTDGDTPTASIVLVSDGQSTVGPPPLDVADEAVRAGIRVYTVGIGTEEGGVVNTQGRRVVTRLDEATLREIAELTGGAYYSANTASELTDVYEQLARERQFETEDTELTFAFTAGALALSIIGGAMSLLWFSRLP